MSCHACVVLSCLCRKIDDCKCDIINNTDYYRISFPEIVFFQSVYGVRPGLEKVAKNWLELKLNGEFSFRPHIGGRVHSPNPIWCWTSNRKLCHRKTILAEAVDASNVDASGKYLKGGMS